jgi:hypothetical protein
VSAGAWGQFTTASIIAFIVGFHLGHNYQFVWWGWRSWQGWGHRRWKDGLAKIYHWSFLIGPLEIRRWVI